MSLKIQRTTRWLKDERTLPKSRMVLSFCYRLFRVGLAAVLVFYFSLIVSSNPVSPHQFEEIERAINLLDEKGFTQDATLLRRVTLFRNTDNWLNSLAEKDSAFAAANCPFWMITIYPDFYNKAQDDTERAMILLHESQHLKGGGEREAYSYVWTNRHQLGWTILPYGTTETFITTEQQTRDNAPELFTCPDNLWSDCTEMLKARR
jgi:hypothetical protein